MKFSVRGRLFLVSIALLGVFGATSTLYLSRSLRPALDGRVEADLWRQARAARAFLTDLDTRDPPAADAFADRLGEATGTRVSIIDADGRVLGDSRLDGAALRDVENHAGRPEVRAALAGRPEVARRRSATVGEELLYVALRTDTGQIIRLATPLSEVDAAMAQIRSLLWVAAALGLIVAIMMSVFASEILTRPLRKLLASARDLAEGKTRHPIPIDSTDELGGLAGSINRLGNSLQEVVATLAEERDRMQAVLSGTDEAVLALDAEHRVVLTNPAGRQLLGEDAVGRPLVDSLGQDALYPALVGRLRATPQSFEIELADRWLLIRVTPQARGDGWIIVMLDITRLRRLEKMRQDFVANVSHELRTPISVIRANAETLLDGAIDDPVAGRRFLEALARNAERLSNLIADLLDIARIEAGKVAIELDRVSLGAVSALAADSVQAVVSDRRTTFDVDVPDGLAVIADGKALEQVFINLLENAVKYTPEGGTVTLWARPHDDVVRIEVRDDGPGIPVAHRARVFERFYRVDAGRSSDMGGTGLGLAIVKHLVASMNGRVGVLPNTPRGSIFWVELPVA